MKKFSKILSCILCLTMLFSAASSSFSVSAAAKNTVKTSITKIEPKAKGFKVTWKKKSKIKGYQIQYSTSSKFKKSASKTKLVTKAKTKSATISKLNGCNKKYYVRIRTYKQSSGKKLYSSWSKAKKATTKKHKYSSGSCAYCGEEIEIAKSVTATTANSLTEAQIRAIITQEIQNVTATTANSLTEAQIRAIITQEIQKSNTSVDVASITQSVIDAVNNQEKFVPGKKLSCPFGTNFLFPIRYRDNQFATINKIDVTKVRINDPKDPSSYEKSTGDYYRYLYDVIIEGRVSAEFAGETITIYLKYEDNAGILFSYNTTVNADGTFKITFLQHLDVNTDFVYPHRIEIGFEW